MMITITMQEHPSRSTLLRNAYCEILSESYLPRTRKTLFLL